MNEKITDIRFNPIKFYLKKLQQFRATKEGRKKKERKRAVPTVRSTVSPQKSHFNRPLHPSIDRLSSMQRDNILLRPTVITFLLRRLSIKCRA